MAMEIDDLDLASKRDDVPVCYVKLPEGFLEGNYVYYVLQTYSKHYPLVI